MLTRMWILAFGLVLLGTPAEAVSCRADSCQKKERAAGDASGKDLQPRLPVMDELAPGLRKKGEPPPGDEIDWRGREWRNRIATLPAISTQESGRASLPIPEPTSLVLFGAGLLLARAAVRRRRSQAVRAAITEDAFSNNAGAIRSTESAASVCDSRGSRDSSSLLSGIAW